MGVQSIIAADFTRRQEQLIVCSTQATKAHSSIHIVDFRSLQANTELVADVAIRYQDLDGQGTCYKTLPLLYCTGNMSWNADPLHFNLTCKHGNAQRATQGFPRMMLWYWRERLTVKRVEINV